MVRRVRNTVLVAVAAAALLGTGYGAGRAHRTGGVTAAGLYTDACVYTAGPKRVASGEVEQITVAGARWNGELGRWEAVSDTDLIYALSGYECEQR